MTSADLSQNLIPATPPSPGSPSTVPPSSVAPSPEGDNLQHLNEYLYKHNLELATLNKTLSLLQKLYEISLLELDPISLADKVSDVVRNDLNLEIVGVLVYDKGQDELIPLHFSKSKRLVTAVEKINFAFRDIQIKHASAHSFFGKSISNMNPTMTNDFVSVWGGQGEDETIKKIQDEAHIKTTLVYPLVTQSNVIGFLLFGFNRDYGSLSDRERESIKNVSAVTAVALDKANLYKALQDANQKLEEVDKRKTEFLSLASHQLRTPITAIKGYTSMFLEGSYGEVSEQQREPISRVFQSSLNLANVVEDLLDVAKIEQGGMKYVYQDVDLEQVTSALSKEFALTAKSKGLELKYENTGAVPCMVSADPVKFRQVILNLLDNSIKYTQQGFVKLSIQKEITAGSAGMAVVSISDSGMGMSPETKTKLFGKFARGEGTKVNAGGSGIGLYLVKELVEAHHGTVSADSEGVGKGSTFTVKIPLKVS